MSRSRHNRLHLSRHGFSLMEMIIATAILAASGAALFALIGQASNLALRAEERTVCLQLAQSVMAESLAITSETTEQQEGTFETDPRWSYKVEKTDVSMNDQGTTSLIRVVVTIMPSEQQNSGGVDASDSAVVRLVRWARPRKSSEQADELQTESSPESSRESSLDPTPTSDQFLPMEDSP